MSGAASDVVLLRDVDVRGQRRDVTVAAGFVQAVRPAGTPHPGPGGEVVEVVDGHGGALLPGLHDHHLHAAALAAARRGVDSSHDLTALVTAPGDGWIRATGYHEDVAGPLDRYALDRLVPHRPVRVQHRSGALWILNTAALARVAATLDDSPDVERDADGTPTGRLWRYDARLRPALPADLAGLTALGGELAAYGITGITDATPDLDEAGLALLATLPQRVTALGAATGADLPAGLRAGPRKLLLRDHDLPPLDDLAATIDASHADGRPVAVHCVTRVSLVLTLAALDAVGTLPGDRIEHASVAPPELVTWLARAGLAVATQPDFLRTRGPAYRRDVDPEDRPHLYPYARLLRAGVATVASSDAPYGDPDPWRTIASAADPDLHGPDTVAPATTLQGYLTEPDTPGGTLRRVTPGARADLVLLHAPLAPALAAPSAATVRATWTAGARTYPPC